MCLPRRTKAFANKRTLGHSIVQMETAVPPPAPTGRVNRFGTWMRARKWRRWLVLSIVWLVGVLTLFAAWIGVAILRGSTERNAAAVALNLVIVFFLAIVGLITMHRGLYRWFWHIDCKRAAGKLLLPGDPGPTFGSEPTAPPPRIAWPWTLRLRHAIIYVAGMLTLLYAFAPYDNQLAIMHFVIAHSAGPSSAGSLNTLLFGYLPIMVLAMLAMLLTWRQMRRRDAGLLDARGKVLLEAEVSWLFSFGAAFTVTAFLCRWGGSMIVAYL
jgi:hypothetical protein